MINNLICLPCHAPPMPMSPATGAVNPATNVAVGDLKSALQVSHGTPPHAHGLTKPLAQIALHPFPAQYNRQEPERSYDARNDREIAPNYDVFGSHVKWALNARFDG
jgi:hypothetical protein